MIKTDFMAECANCPHLEVKAISFNLQNWGNETWYEHTITCEHMDKCRCIKEHLGREMQKNGN